MNNMKLCKDCKHLGSSVWGTNTYCKRPTGINPLDGSTKIVDEFCIVERSTGWFYSVLFKECGKEGRYFEEKTND